MSPTSHILLYSLSAVCTAVTCTLTSLLIYRHLQNWADPVGQRYTVRILLLLPVYTLCSVLVIHLPRLFIYLDSVRELYEAFALYQFVLLMLHYFYKRAPAHFHVLNAVRHEDKCQDSELHAEENLELLFAECEPVTFCGCLSFHATEGKLRFLRYAVLQYLVVRVVLTFINVGLQESGLYHHRSLDPAYAYLWIAVMNNVSISFALFGVLQLLSLLHTVIWAHDPVLKFLSLKLVIFCIFWQSILFSASAYADIVPVVYFQPWSSTETVGVLDNSLICVEMALLSLYHHWIFRFDETQRTSTLKACLEGVSHESLLK